MILPIPIVIHITQKITWSATERGIPPLIFKRHNTGIKKIVTTLVAWDQFEILLTPIQKYSCSCQVKCVFPIQRGFNQYGNVYSENAQSKKMAPHKLQHLFGLFPNSVYISHFVPPHLYDQVSTNFIKNIPKKTPNINELQYVCPLFNKEFNHQGEECHELQ